MHVKRPKPLWLSGGPPYPSQAFTRLSNIEDIAREGFTFEVMCLTGVPVPRSDSVPRYVHPTITGKKPWSTPFESQQSFPVLPVGNSAGRPSTSDRQPRGGGICDEHKLAGGQAPVCRLSKPTQR